jgi:5,10-methylenetetrahydromethanopterin reductase
MHMKFGAGLFDDISRDRTTELARLVEKRKFHQIWISDERFYRDPYALLTLCALSTRKIKLGTAVTDPYIRHASLTSLAVATVDEISDGRMVLGIGAGISGFEELGIKREKPAVAIEEAVTVIRDLWAGRSVSKNGEFVYCKDLKLNFKARANIPVYIAGRGPTILTMAGRIGDGAIVGGLGSKKGMAYATERIREGLDRRRPKVDLKDFDVVLWISTAISDDEKEARDLLRPLVSYILYSSRNVLSTLGIGEDVAGPVLRALDAAGEKPPGSTVAASLIPDALVDALSLAGKPGEIAERIMELEETGVKQIALLPYAPKGKDIGYVLNKFATEVMPRLR